MLFFLVTIDYDCAMTKYILSLVLQTLACVGFSLSVLAAEPDTAGNVHDSVPAEWLFSLDVSPAVAKQGMVATDAALATRAGVEVLRGGGNAIDAAVATAFVLAVVLPEAGNLGGGGFLIVRAADGEVAALDFRETAPGAASRDMYLDKVGNSTDLSITGQLAAGVPGSVAGMWAVHQRFGSKPWAALLAPAIALAGDGFELEPVFADWTAHEAERHRRFAGSEQLFLANGEPLKAGDQWRNPDLADTLTRIADNGPAGFYQGRTADLIVAEMTRGNGIINHDDLKTYRPVWREPVTIDYEGHRIITMPPPSSGGITMALMARMLSLHQWRDLPWHSVDSLHLLTESMRRAFAVRNTYLGDPDYISISIEELLSKPYAERLGASIQKHKATPSAEILLTSDPARESMHTTHFSIVDGMGNAVAMTTSINTSSAVTVEGAGFLLNNEMDDFTAKPGAANVFGLVQGESNAILPGKRMLSSMTPTIVLDNSGQPVMVTGASGGPTIITGTFQVISNRLVHDLPIRFAVNAPRVHHQHLPDTLYMEENGLATKTLNALNDKGHHIDTAAYIGRAATVVRHDGGWQGVADPRIGGLAAGY